MGTGKKQGFSIEYLDSRFLSYIISTISDKGGMGGTGTFFLFLLNILKSKLIQYRRLGCDDNIQNAQRSLDKLKASGYNIDDISEYASRMMDIGRYDEAWTEYRTTLLIKGSSFTPQGVTSFCVRKQNDVFALQKMILTASRQTMLCPCGHKHKK